MGIAWLDSKYFLNSFDPSISYTQNNCEKKNGKKRKGAQTYSINREYNNYYHLVSIKDSLSNKLFDLQLENKWLEDNKEYIEKVAREKYLYIYPDEKIINF